MSYESIRGKHWGRESSEGEGKWNVEREDGEGQQNLRIMKKPYRNLLLYKYTIKNHFKKGA